MPMQMPRMTRRTQNINNDPHSLVRPQVVHIPIRIRSRIADVPTLRQQQYRIVIVRFKRTIIDSPDNMAGSVDSDGDVHSDRSVGIGGCDGIYRYRIGKRIVKTGGVVSI